MLGAFRALSNTSPQLQVKAFPTSLPFPGAVGRGEEEAVRCLRRGGLEGRAPELPRRHLLPVRRFNPFGLSYSCCSDSVMLKHPFDGVFSWPRVADVRVENLKECISSGYPTCNFQFWCAPLLAASRNQWRLPPWAPLGTVGDFSGAAPASNMWKLSQVSCV